MKAESSLCSKGGRTQGRAAAGSGGGLGPHVPLVVQFAVLARAAVSPALLLAGAPLCNESAGHCFQAAQAQGGSSVPKDKGSPPTCSPTEGLRTSSGH